MAKRKSRVFIDTNTIMGEAYFKSVRASAFLKAAKILGIEIIIPEVVIDEVEGNLARSFQEKFDKYLKAHKSLGELITLDDLDITSDYEISRINDERHQLLSNHDVKILPYPNLELKKIVCESYLATKPFKLDGDGYKDYIIWATIKEYLDRSKDKRISYFITNNTSDFCDIVDGKNSLHPALVSQFKDSSIAPKVFRDLKTFFDEIIAPSLPGLNLKAIADLALNNLEDEAQEILEDYLPGRAVYGFSECPFTNDVTISSVTNAIEVTDTTFNEIGEEQILIKIVGTVDVDTNGYIDKSDYYSDESPENKMYVLNGDYNDHVMEVGANITIPFELIWTYERKKKKMIAQQVDLPSEIHPDWYQ